VQLAAAGLESEALGGRRGQAGDEVGRGEGQGDVDRLVVREEGRSAPLGAEAVLPEGVDDLALVRGAVGQVAIVVVGEDSLVVGFLDGRAALEQAREDVLGAPGPLVGEVELYSAGGSNMLAHATATYAIPPKDMR